MMLSIGVTVSSVEPETPPQLAVIVVEPAANEVANPMEPVAVVLLIVATDGDDEFHVAEFVKICVVLSENVPVAINCCFAPRAMLGFTGVISNDVIVTTAIVVEPDTLPDDAVIVVEPVVKAVANPDVLFIFATAVLDESHVTSVVMFRVELSEYLPVAVNC